MNDDVMPANTPRGRAKGGKARAESMTPEQRKDAARKAAAARWKTDGIDLGATPRATHMGVLQIGDAETLSAALENGQRVLTERAFLHAMGRDARAKSKKHIRDGDAVGLPPFMTAKVLEPYIRDIVRAPVVPIRFRLPEDYNPASTALGYNAELLPEVCRVFVAAAADGKLTKQQLHIAAKCQLLLDGLANIGIVALVDEATGFQAERRRNELQTILAAYITPEFLPWQRRFPESYYREMFRLLGWEFTPPQIKRPNLIGRLTDELIYKQLPTGVRDELKRRNPPTPKGYRRHKHHQLLTPEIGNGHLERQIAAVTTLMRAAQGNRKLFNQLFKAAFPKPGEQLSLGLVPEDDD
jgi:hypothetical protein